MSTDLKFCKDCKHFSRAVPVHFSRCGAFRDPVTGGPGEFADLQRKYNFGSHCGADGKHFEPKPARKSLLQRLFG